VLLSALVGELLQLCETERVCKWNSIETLHSDGQTLEQERGFTWIVSRWRNPPSQLWNEILTYLFDGAHDFKGYWIEEMYPRNFDVFIVFAGGCIFGGWCGGLLLLLFLSSSSSSSSLSILLLTTIYITLYLVLQNIKYLVISRKGNTDRLLGILSYVWACCKS